MQVGGCGQDTLKIEAITKKDHATFYRGVLVCILIVSPIIAKCAKEQMLKINNDLKL